MPTQSGFEPTLQGLSIDKDPQAELTYTFDWSEWLLEADQIDSVEYDVQARANDPQPLIKLTDGVVGGDKTFVELASGQHNKTYTVAATVTTTNGLKDRRSFRVRVLNRSA